MAIVPSWQQIPPQHAAIQQPLLSDAGDWGRPLIVDSSGILQEQRPVFPVDVTTEVYNPSMVDHSGATWTSSSKRSSKNSHHQQSSHHSHHLMVPSNHHRSQVDKKEQTQLSPVKKRVKESTPPSDQSNSYQNCNTSSSRRGGGGGGGNGGAGHSPNGHWQHNHHNSVVKHQPNEHIPTGRQQHTITIHDTPSPAVSVITISDSEDESTGKSSNKTVHVHRQNSTKQRKNVISCVTVADSDGEDHRSPAKLQIQNQIYQQQVIKHEPQQNGSSYTTSSSSSSSSQSQKKRLLAKAQSECMLNVPTKQEPGTDYHHHHRSNDYLISQNIHGSHCSSACKEPLNSGSNYYVNASSANHSGGQEQHVVYSTSDKRVSWAPPAAHAPSSNSRRHSAVPVVNLRDYNIQTQGHKEYIQPPAAHTTRESLAVGREQHLLATAKGWGGSHQTLHQGYRFVHFFLPFSYCISW